MTQFSHSFEIFSQAPAVYLAIFSSQTLDRICRGVQANMANILCYFQWLFENRDRDVGSKVPIFWIPIRMKNELGNIGILRLISSIIIVFEIKVGFRSFSFNVFFFVLQAVGGEQNMSWSYCKNRRINLLVLFAIVLSFLFLFC